MSSINGLVMGVVKAGRWHESSMGWDPTFAILGGRPRQPGEALAKETSFYFHGKVTGEGSDGSICT
jgi:hypothetical protein